MKNNKLLNKININFRSPRWKRRDVILLLERLELYVSAGLTIDKALMASEEGMKKRQKAILRSIRTSVEQGGSLSRALMKNKVISATLAGLIGHGESTGRLGETLSSARALVERQDELIKKCLSAMAYPVVIGLFASGLTIGLVRGIMPQIIPMLKSLNVTLPLLTRVVIWFSETFLSYGLYIFGSLALFITTLIFGYKLNRAIRSICQGILVKIPLIGRLIRHYVLSVFLRSCGSLIHSGVSVPMAFESTTGTIALLPIKRVLESEIATVNRGVPLGVALSRPRLHFPGFVSQLLSAGESSGTLGNSAVRAANIIDRDIEHMLKRATSLIEPVMMAGMGTVVGGIALSIMMPIYDVSKVLHA